MANNIATIQADGLRTFFARVKPYYAELFNMAHAICGNYELAEYAVQSAILDVFRRGSPHSRAGLRETLRAQTRGDGHGAGTSHRRCGTDLGWLPRGRH